MYSILVHWTLSSWGATVHNRQCHVASCVVGDDKRCRDETANTTRHVEELCNAVHDAELLAENVVAHRQYYEDKDHQTVEESQKCRRCQPLV